MSAPDSNEERFSSEITTPIRTWPSGHPPVDHGQIRSCIELSTAPLVPMPRPRSQAPQGSPITANIFPPPYKNVQTPTSQQNPNFGTEEERASRSSSIHEISGAYSLSSGGAGCVTGSSRRTSLSHLTNSTRNSTFLNDVNHYLGLNHLNLEFGDEDNSLSHSVSSSASAMSGMDHHDSDLEDLHRQQDAEFQDILADFADQQNELEQRMTRTSHSHNSLSLSSVVSNEDTSESSCGTLSEIFESLSRFSEHCLASVEALNSPIYRNTSSFTTTPTGPGDNFEFKFDHELPLFGLNHAGQRRSELRAASAPFPSIQNSQSADTIEGSQEGTKLKNDRRREFFRSMLGAQDEEGTVGHGSNRFKTNTNPFQQFPETNQVEAQTVKHTGESGGCRSPIHSKNIPMENIGLELEIFGGVLHFGSLIDPPGASGGAVVGDNRKVGESEENSIVAALTGESLVKPLDWQERCVELELALQRFREQTTRARLMLRDKGGSLPDILQWVELPIVSDAECQINYRDETILPSMLCAGFSEGGKDSCQGDSGGPLVATAGNYLAGILAELERRVVEAETRADEAEDKVRVMEQQLSEASANSAVWAMGEDTEKLCTLQLAVREKDRVISRLECQVEEQRLLRLNESRQVEEKAAKIKIWVSNKLRDLEEQNEHLREQNQKCETQLDLLKSRLTQISTLELSTLQSSKSKDRHSTEDSSRGSYEGDRIPSDESPPPDTTENNGHHASASQASQISRCIAEIRRRSGAFDTPEERERRRRTSNLSNGSISGGTNNSLRDTRDSRSSRVDSGSVDMETPQSLSPRSPLDNLEALDGSLPPNASNMPNGAGTSSGSSQPHRSPTVSSHFPPATGHGIHFSQSATPSQPNPGHNNSSNNNNHVIISTPHPVPQPVPVLQSQPITISHSPSPATPSASDILMIGGSDSTHSLMGDRRVPIVPPRRCRTRSPTPNTSHGTTPDTTGTCSPPTEEEDASVLRARLDAECQQLARDLQAAVRELVRPELSLVGGRTSASSSAAASGKNFPNGGPSGSAYTKGKAMDEVHDYSEIYTPSGDNESPHLGLSQPPPRPIHRFPSWESRIYEVAAGGLKVPSNGRGNSSVEISGNGRVSYNSLGINFSIPVYTTVKGRASQIRSAPFSGDSSDSESDGEEIGSGSGSGPSHPVSSNETDLSSPGKSAPSSIANSLSPLHRSSSSPSKSVRREPSFGESEMSDDYAIPPDAFASETSSLDIAISSGIKNGRTGDLSGGIVTVGPSSVSSNPPGVIHSVESSPRKESLEKSGHLTKLGGKLKTWRKRYFVLKNGTLTYWKTQQEAFRRPTGRDIILDENCRINRVDGASTFEIVTGKKTYYLTADSTISVDEWVRVLQNVVRRNATKLVLSMEDNHPTIQGWLTKVKNGHAKRCWCLLIGKMFLTFKSPSDTMASGQVNMRDARCEDVDHVSDSDNDDKDEQTNDAASDAFTIGIFPTHQSPIYLHCSTKQEKDSWLYYLTIVSGKGPSAGTQFEQLIHKLMELDGDPNSSLWKNPLLLHSKESITTPLTSLSSEIIQNEAIKLFKSVMLFMSVPLDSSGIDYHVVLAQNALQLCLDVPELQAELICDLVKQTSRQMSYKSSAQVNRTLHKIKHSRHFLLNATQSLFLCDSSSSHHGKLQQSNQQSPPATTSSTNPSASLQRGNNHQTAVPANSVGSTSKMTEPNLNFNGKSKSICGSSSSRTSPSKSSKAKTGKGSSSSVPSSPLMGSHNNNHGMHHRTLSSEGKLLGFRLLAIAVSLFLPKNNKLLWYLKQHLSRNADNRSECGKYAAYCQRSIERTLANGPRLFKPSRMEVLSILMKNPFHHSLPHSIPVHFLNGTYQVVGFDGSTTVEEFLHSLCHEICCREPSISGFALFEDDPFEKDLEHFLKPEEKICDVISKWETALRERGSGKFETRRACTLSFKSRIYKRAGVLQETDRERLLLCLQTNQHVVSGKFPLTRELALELAALMAQIDGGDYKPEKVRGSGGSQLIVQILEKYYPIRYRDSLSQEEYKTLCDSLVEKWSFLKGKSTLDCVRIYLTCTRKWPFFGATLFNVNVRGTHIIEDGSPAWAAICEDGIAVLDNATLQQIAKYSFTNVQTFGGAVDDHFMIVVDDCGKKRRLLFGGMSKFKVLEITRLVADYINACCGFYSSQTGASNVLTRHNSLKSCRFQGSTTLPPPTPRMERRHLGGTQTNASPIPLQRSDSTNNYQRTQPRP